MNDLSLIVSNNVDVLCIAETKLDKSFPEHRFLLKGYKRPYRFDVTDASGGLLVYVNSAIPSRRLPSLSLPADFQVLLIELNLRHHKWLVVSIYRHHSQNLPYFLTKLSSIVEYYSASYESIVILGDFNGTPTSVELTTFMSTLSLHSLINTPTCFKSADGSCIDLILTNKKHSFQKCQTFETGVSDHHHMIYTMLKQTFVALPCKKISYRSFKKFSIDSFKVDLEKNLSENTHSGDFSSLNSALEVSLEKHAPYKTRVVRGNNKPHVSKALRKAIMTRSRLKNIYNKTRSRTDFENYKKQRNYVVNLNLQEKRQFFRNLSMKANDGAGEFWAHCKPFFTNKSISSETVSLLEGGEVTQSESVVAKVFNSYFVNITKSLPINQWKPYLICYDIFDIIKKFSDHPSIKKIREFDYGDSFCFSHIYPWETYKVLVGLNPAKSSSGAVPAKILRSVAKSISVPLTDCFNNCIADGIFPSELKLASVIPVFKSGDVSCKEDYRPISILPSLSKVFEKLLFMQISAYFDSKFSKLLCGFRANYSTQHALLRLVKQWQACLDSRGKVGTILMDLSKAFDSLPHDLLLAKLSAYGFKYGSLKLMFSYLRGRFQRVKIGTTFSEWLEILLGVPQGSILGPLLFNIFINDFFAFITSCEVCNYADDNTLYSCSSTFENVVSDLESGLIKALRWLDLNQLVANPEKFQVMFLGVNAKKLSLRVKDKIIISKDYVKLLGITIDDHLKFDKHINDICKKANFKVNCLYRIRKYVDEKQASTLCNAFVLSNFYYCPLIWMFCNKGLGKKIDSVHKRALRAVTGTFEKSFDEMLLSQNAITIHQRNLRVLATEIYKCLSDQYPQIVRELFLFKSSIYDFRSGILLSLPPTKSVRFGLNSIIFRASQLWNSLPGIVKKSHSVAAFKDSLENLEMECFCTLCSK